MRELECEMSPGKLPMTAGLASLAHGLGVDHDLTPFAVREQAFNEMVAAAVSGDDQAWDDAKARFDAATPALRRAA